MPRPFLTMILLVALVFTTAACMGDDDDDGGSSSPASDVSADEVLATASDAWAETETAHFTLEVDGDAYLDSDETIKLVSAEGDIKRPGSVKATATVDAQISVIDISLVAVDREIFITNLLTGNWERAPEDFSYDPSVLFSDTDGIGPIMTDLQNAEVEDTEDVNGRSAYRVNGTVTADRVEEITAGTIEGEEIEVTLWTAVDDGTLLRVVLTEPEGVRESPATWTLNLTDHGEDVEIDAPDVASRTS
jgi:lipoprotein LprG